jgi:signal transduction histidine kinase
VLIIVMPLWHAASFTLLVMVRSGRPWRSVAPDMFGPDVWISMLSLSMGALGGMVSTINPLLVLPAAFPVVLAYAALIAVARQFATQAKVQALATELQALNTCLEQKVAERTADVARLMELRLTETSAAVHDMRHRMRSVEMTIDTLQMVLPSSVLARPLVHAVHERLKGAVAALYTLLGEVLDAALMERGQLQMRPQHTDLRTIAREVQRQLDARCAAQDCEFTLDLPDAPLWAWCDPQRIERVYYNLCDNAVTFAVDAAESTGAVPQVHVWFSVADTAIGCHVGDNGPGIAADDIMRLGELGLRLHAEPTRVEGSGLGLNFCFRALSLNGGRLEIASEGLGKGSTVTAWLPMAGNLALPLTESPLRATVPSTDTPKELQ